MHGLTIINDDIYYERTDGTYAKLPYDDSKASVQILEDRLMPDELVDLVEAMARRAYQRDPERTMEVLRALV
ncbi:hypothetical protein ACIBBD_02145 [Streptomyces sp. NPDC051315]|uniref:hypothetical protein n=1 Tax=Streptomyces sp. NPDC051315 TaxID=3365650 RepID=UPI0037B417A4